MSVIENSDLSKYSTSEIRKGETISELAHRHLLNQNHTTTDEELKNAVFEFSDKNSVGKDGFFETENTTVTSPVPEGTNVSRNNQYSGQKSFADY